MSNGNLEKSNSDWERVAHLSEDAPIPYEAADGPYDPNAADAARAYLDSCQVVSGSKVLRAVVREKASSK
jgi:hypothetical protein